jgi:hypothetical protein
MDLSSRILSRSISGCFVIHLFVQVRIEMHLLTHFTLTRIGAATKRAARFRAYDLNQYGKTKIQRGIETARATRK